MKSFTACVIGGGSRGEIYAKFALDNPDKFKIVAVAEPVKERRENFRELYNLSDEFAVKSWEELLNRPKFCDLAIIATMDRMHFEPCMKAIELGYDILLEKPMSIDEEECFKIAAAAKKRGVKILVCHVLRFTPFFMALKGFLNSGRLGRIMNVVHTEGVGNVHQSHSFVRGNWGNSDQSSPMILQKSCHDMDILQWLLDEKCTQVQSFGKLSYFKKENKPEGSPERCIEGCPYADTCYYNAVKLYLDDKDNYWFRSASTFNPHPTDEDVERVLRTAEFGKCVFNCNNNVVDHQVVNLAFTNDIYVSFTMSAFDKGGRRIRIMGENGELFGNASKNFISFHSFVTGETEDIPFSEIVSKEDITGGHGGGDEGIMNQLYEYLNDTYSGFSICDIYDTAENHLIALAAEKSRINGGKTIDFEEYKKKFTFI